MDQKKTKQIKHYHLLRDRSELIPMLAKQKHPGYLLREEGKPHKDTWHGGASSLGVTFMRSFGVLPSCKHEIKVQRNSLPR